MHDVPECVLGSAMELSTKYFKYYCSEKCLNGTEIYETEIVEYDPKGIRFIILLNTRRLRVDSRGKSDSIHEIQTIITKVQQKEI